MAAVSSVEIENQALKAEIIKLKTQLSLLQDQEFLRKLNLAYSAFGVAVPKDASAEAISWAPGAAKHLVSFIADDFDAPLEDFAEYM